MKIKTLIAMQLVTLIVGLGGLIVAVVGEHTSRINARRDTCHLIVGLVTAATSKSPAASRAAQAYVDRTPLRDCNRYAQGG